MINTSFSESMVFPWTEILVAASDINAGPLLSSVAAWIGNIDHCHSVEPSIGGAPTDPCQRAGCAELEPHLLISLQGEDDCLCGAWYALPF
ncbi:hypothetical protein KQ313_10350 [Synechococcus sp. CS-1325]|uniref:hypothetical protein n=1 Tax=unclassified Synechococcus TaxID=2626047 RepID=UPI0021A6B7CB|nr:MULTISPECIES: hypothetical protein [unclassified Synechococcus]MCT0200079.1 hypothetical protein [Synechococcus sp. CS-1325]MCT0212619.1 hypothetical protein [Synechococcus sp. CS-1326]MCT0233628.1 hypothetical protein [Synechococcus sp. CS-1327]